MADERRSTLGTLSIDYSIMISKVYDTSKRRLFDIPTSVEQRPPWQPIEDIFFGKITALFGLHFV